MAQNPKSPAPVNGGQVKTPDSAPVHAPEKPSNAAPTSKTLPW